MAIEFDKDIDVVALIDKWAEVPKLLSDTNTREQLEFQQRKRKSMDYGKYMRIAISFPRLHYLMDRLKDLNFLMNHLSEHLVLKNELYSKEYVNSYLLLSLPSTINTIQRSLLNFIAYYYDLPLKDENIVEEDVLNYLAIVDNDTALKLQELLDIQCLKILTKLKLSIENGYIAMNKLKSEKKGDTNNIEVLFNHEDHISQIKDSVNQYLLRLIEFSDFFINRLHFLDRQSGGYISPNDLYTKIDSKTEFLKGVENKEVNKKSRISYLKIYNLYAELPPKIDYPSFSIHRNLTYERIEERLYRPNKKVKQTVDLTVGEPSQIKKVIYPVSEGEMLWTHTLAINSNKVRDIKKFEEDICLLLSLFNKNAVFSEKNYIHYSHKGNSQVYLEAQEYKDNLGKALANLHKKRNDKQKLIRGLLKDYWEIKQPESFTSEFIKLWNIIDKLGTYFSTTSKSKRKFDTQHTLNSVIEILNKDPILCDLNIAKALEFEYSIRKQNEKLLKDTLKIQDFIGVEYSVLRKEITKLYDFRSQLIHKPDLHLEKIPERTLIDHYLFLWNLVFLIFLILLNLKPTYTIKKISQEMVGFLSDDEYYIKLHKQNVENQKSFDNMMKILSGEIPRSEGKTTYTI